VDKAPAPVQIFFRGTRGEAAKPDWIEEKEKKSEKENKLRKKRIKRKEKTKVHYIPSQ
jgi:hypothetical protein